MYVLKVISIIVVSDFITLLTGYAIYLAAGWTPIALFILAMCTWLRHEIKTAPTVPENFEL